MFLCSLSFLISIFQFIADIDNMQSRGTLNNSSEIPNEFEYNIDDQPIASWKVFNSENDDVEKISSILKSASSTIHSDANFTSPSCLPLDFFYVYQVLQENELMEKCGHVRMRAARDVSAYIDMFYRILFCRMSYVVCLSVSLLTYNILFLHQNHWAKLN